jgi:hypothetical protein
MAQSMPIRGIPASDAERKAARTHTISLLTLFVGVPVSFVVASIYQLAVGTASMGGDVEVTGWRAVLYNLPTTILVLAVTITSVVFAARALRMRAPGAAPGLWLSVGGLFLVLMVMGFGIQETFEQPNQPLADWGIRVGAAAAAAATMLWCRRYARTASG